MIFKMKEAELTKALASVNDAKAEAEKAQQEIQAAKKIAAVRHSLYKASMWRRHFFYLPGFGALQGHSQICHATSLMLRSSTGRGGELNGEAVLVLVCWGRTPNASE